MNQIQIALCCVLSLLMVTTGCAALNGTPKLTPTTLRCEYKVDPLGIDQTTPRFDWQLKSDQPEARDQKQSAYQILVASNEKDLNSNRGDLWDSGVVKSDATAQINYAGAALKSEQHALWKVRTWNAQGEPGAWSKPATFSIGLLDPADWKAKWIGYDAPAPPAADQLVAGEITLDGLKWLWSETTPPTSQATTAPATQFAGSFPAPGSIPIGSRFFEKVITLPAGKIVRASAVITADQRFELFVNDHTAGFGSSPKQAWALNIAQYLHSGTNTLNIWARSERPGHFGVIGRFRIQLENQPPIDIDLDTTWKVASGNISGPETAPKRDSDAWKKPEVVGAIGDAPWGDVSPRKLNL